jgi:hypothetical protein
MPRFAVCYVPPSRSPFYRLATGIIRYDIRAGRVLSENNPIRAQIPNFSEKYVERLQVYGLHCTIVGPYECRRGDLPAIQAEIQACLRMLEPSGHACMTNHDEFVTFWGKNRQIVALHYLPNARLMVLHTLLLTRLIDLLGYGARLKSDTTAHLNPAQVQRVERFGHAHVLDGYHPHFTLLHPYSGSTHDHIAALLQGIFGGFHEHILDNICLMTQDQPGQSWRIHTEFHCVTGA